MMLKIRRIIHVGLEQIKLPTTENKVSELVDTFLETHEFPQCVGAIEAMYIDIAKPKKHFSDYSNRKGCLFLNTKAVCDWKYCKT